MTDRSNLSQSSATGGGLRDELNMAVPKNTAIVGGNAFSHSSGIHVDAFLKAPTTYEIIEPQEVGFPL